MSEVDICNQGISWVGGNLITNFDDGTTEADLCKANYAELRDVVLEDREWTFALEWARITPVVGDPVNLSRWTYKFLLDSKVIRVVEVVGENDNPITYVKEGRHLYSNASPMLLRYITRVTDTTLFSSGFKNALAARIAAEFAIPLAESRSLQADMFKLYGDKLIDAFTTDAMQGTPRRVRNRSFHKVR